MTDTAISVQAAAQVSHVKVQGLSGVSGRFLELASDDGLWMIRVPRSAFQQMNANAGDTIIIGLSLVRIAMEEAGPPSSQLILPGRGGH